jgi:hypothetical protein
MAPPPALEQRKDSQFAGAAAVFRNKESDNASKTPGKSPTKKIWTKANGNASMTNINFSPPILGGGSGGVGKNSKLAPPPFVSPGAGTTSAKAKFTLTTTSYLNKPSGTPSQSSKPKLTSPGFNGLPFTPSPATMGGKPKVNANSWKDKVGGGFTSPSSVTSSTIDKANASISSIQSPTIGPMSYYGGSYLNKGNDTKNTVKPKNTTTSGGMEEAEPDIKIQVKIDIQEKLRARQKTAKLIQPKEDNIPEHIRKAREREERRIRAEEEKEYRSALLVQAVFLGWYARVQYPKLLAANQDRLNEIRRREALTKKREQAALKIQSTFRMYIPRKRYVFVRDCKRRRERNAKEIKQIEKTIKNMPKKVKAEIKDMKKEYAEKKKDIKKSMKKRVKDEEQKLEEIRKSGQDMIEYWKAENERVKQQKNAIKAEQKVLEKQTEVLAAKSEEIEKNFKSLTAWVKKKTTEMKKHEESDYRCRHRYLPQYRADIAERNKHCKAEYTVKELYKKQLKRIVKEIEKRSKDPELASYVKKQMKACQKEIKAIPEVPVPEGLEQWLKG